MFVCCLLTTFEAGLAGWIFFLTVLNNAISW